MKKVLNNNALGSAVIEGHYIVMGKRLQRVVLHKEHRGFDGIDYG